MAEALAPRIISLKKELKSKGSTNRIRLPEEGALTIYSLGFMPFSLKAEYTFSTREDRTLLWSFNTLETVAADTPASFAISESEKGYFLLMSFLPKYEVIKQKNWLLLIYHLFCKLQEGDALFQK